MDSGTSVGKFELKQLQLNDLLQVEKLYAACRNALATNGLDQWQDGYPHRQVIQNDIARTCLWGDANFTAVAALNRDHDPQHKLIPWNGDDDTSRFVHRLAVHPKLWGKGVGVRIMEQLERLAQNQGALSIRLDTYSLNHSNLKFYQKLGYSQLEGEVYFQPHEAPFTCFEKIF